MDYDTAVNERPSRFAMGGFLSWLLVTLGWWALAFAPLPVPPEWLAEARSVCFGTLPNGLPDTWGWILLVLAPLSMLTFLVVVWGRELLDSARWVASRSGGWLLIASLLGAPLLGAGWVGQRVAAAGRAGDLGPVPWTGPLPAHYPRLEEPAAPFALVDQHGEEVTLESLRGRPVLLTFAYAHCATICPVIVETAHKVVGALPGQEPAVLVVTLDPWRDTPRTLPTVARSWRLDRLPDGRVLSGPVEEVLAVIDAYEVPIERDEKSGEVFHPALVYLLDGEGRLAYRFHNPPAEWLVQALLRMAGSQA
jgi:protein SCO1